MVTIFFTERPAAGYSRDAHTRQGRHLDASHEYHNHSRVDAASLLRILVALAFLPRLEEVRKPRRSMSPRQLVFRVTRFNAFSGLLYEVVSFFRGK